MGMLFFRLFSHKELVTVSQTDPMMQDHGLLTNETAHNVESLANETVHNDGLLANETVHDAGPADEVQEEPKKIAITFDDGPHPVYTEQLLDGLEERGVRATFFVTGEHASLHPDIIRRMSEEGHLIGNHTYSHMRFTKDSREVFKDELLRTNQVISGITGKDVLYVRPPYGAWDKSFETELNMFPVLWSVDPLDWCTKDVACIVRSTVQAARENDIILLHDYYDTSVTAALFIIDQLQKEGFSFVTVDEILFD